MIFNSVKKQKFSLSLIFCFIDYSQINDNNLRQVLLDAPAAVFVFESIQTYGGSNKASLSPES